MADKKWYFGSRRVFAFPRLGIVVKGPRFYWKRGWFVDGYKLGGVIFSLSWTEDQFGSCRQVLTKGLRDNWQEFVFFCRHRGPFLQPTLFSFLGFLNIQLYGKILSEEEFERAKVWRQFFYLTNQEHLSDGHHFEKAANFCAIDGHLRMVDYGSPQTRAILLKWGDALYEQVSLATPSETETQN